MCEVKGACSDLVCNMLLYLMEIKQNMTAKWNFIGCIIHGNSESCKLKYFLFEIRNKRIAIKQNFIKF